MNKVDADRDAKRIVDVFKKHGCDINKKMAKKAWKDFSNSLSSSWMFLPEDDEYLFAYVLPHIQQ